MRHVNSRAIPRSCTGAGQKYLCLSAMLSPHHWILSLYLIIITVLLIFTPAEAAAEETITPPSVESMPSQSDRPALTESGEGEVAEEAKEGSRDVIRTEVKTGDFEPYYMLAGVVLGLLIGMARLATKFMPFLGLGVLNNRYSFIFLGYVVITTVMFYFGISYYFSDLDVAVGAETASDKGGVDVGKQLFVEVASFLTMFGSPIAGNLSTLIGRFTSAGILDTGGSKGIKELEKSKSSNILFEFIRIALADKLDQKIIELSGRYEWDELKSCIGRLIDSEIAFNRISPAEGENVRAFVLSFDKTSNDVEDLDNKYKVLHRAIQFSSFKMLVSRLEGLRGRAK